MGDTWNSYKLSDISDFPLPQAATASSLITMLANDGRRSSIPVEDQSARKTMTANEVQTQSIDRRIV